MSDPNVVNIDRLGPYGYVYFHIGYLLDAFLLGVIVCQFALWKTRAEREEPWAQRALVYYLTLGAFLNTGLIQACGMVLFVQNFGHAGDANLGPWSQGAIGFEIGLAMPVEALFAFRAYQLWDRPRYMLYTFPVVFLASIGIGIANIVLHPTGFIPLSTGPLFIAWASTLLLIDWVVSGLIFVALARKKSGLHRSDKLVMRLIILSAEAQLIPSAAAAGLIIKALVVPTSLLTITLVSLPKVWVISALLAINFRHTYRNELEQERQRRQITLSFIDPDSIRSAEDGRNTQIHTGSPLLPAGASGSDEKTTDGEYPGGNMPSRDIEKNGLAADILDSATLPVLPLQIEYGPTRSSGADGKTQAAGGDNDNTRKRALPSRRKPSRRSSDEDRHGEMSFEEMLGMRK